MHSADGNLGGRPIDAGIGDGNAIVEARPRLGERLAAGEEVALDHGSHDRGVASGDLVEHGAEHLWLALGLPGGIAVTAIHHDGLGQPGFLQQALGLPDVSGAVIGAGGPAAQHDMAIGIAARHDGGSDAVMTDAEKSLGLRRRTDGVDGGLQAAVGAVLEAERHRQAGGHLPVGLRFGGARSDRAPADEVGDVLRRDGVEHLRRGGQAEIEHVAQEGAGKLEALRNVL